MGEKAVWDKANLKHFCDISKEEVLARHRPLGHLNKVGWKNVEVKFAEKSGRKLEHLQLKNKWDNLKRSYTIFMELKNVTTGLGWDDAKQTVDCDDEWWKEHLARYHDPAHGRKCKHVQFRKCGPPNLDSLYIMFGSAHVSGATASIPGDLSDNSSDDEEVAELEKNDDPSELKLSTLKKQKDKKRKAPSSTVIEDKEEKSLFLRLYKQTCSKIETCRHGYTSQNVLAICDFDMRFTFAVAGWPGSAHDTRILNHALTNFGDWFPVPPKDKYYIVDSGYPNRTGYLAPFKGSTYHLPVFHLRRQRAPQGKYEMFNFLHSSLRNVIERAFGVLKQKWRILKVMPSFSCRTQKHIIIACMALHNFIRDSKLRDEEFDRCDEDEDYMPEAAQAVAQPQGDDVPEEENEVTINAIRDRIANALVSARAR